MEPRRGVPQDSEDGELPVQRGAELAAKHGQEAQPGADGTGGKGGVEAEGILHHGEQHGDGCLRI